MVDFLIVASAMLCSLGGLVLLWRGWRDSDSARGRMALACVLWAVSTTLWVTRFGAEIGIPLALETAALVAFAFILTRLERRINRAARERRVDQPASSRRRWVLGTARTLVAGPLGLAAAMGIAVVIATKSPMAEQTRLIIAGLIVPSLWAVGIAWVVCQRRLPVQAATFTMIGVAGFGLTLLVGA